MNCSVYSLPVIENAAFRSNDPVNEYLESLHLHRALPVLFFVGLRIKMDTQLSTHHNDDGGSHECQAKAVQC